MSPNAQHCIDRLQAFYATHGRTPTVAETGNRLGVRKHPDVPHVMTMRKWFGSPGKAYDAAGIPRRPHGRKMMYDNRSRAA